MPIRSAIGTIVTITGQVSESQVVAQTVACPNLTDGITLDVFGALVGGFIATALGIGLAMLLMSALMGLVFLSNGTGHDAAVDNNLDSLEP